MDLEVEWNDPEQSLWELAKANQIELPADASAVVCGCCRVKLLEGDVQYDRQIGIELAAASASHAFARLKPILLSMPSQLRRPTRVNSTQSISSQRC